MSDIERMMAEFAARGGAVRKVAPTEGLHLSVRQWRDQIGWEPEVVVTEVPEEEEEDAS